MSAHNSPPVFYLAGTGLVSPIGASATMTYATFKAGISAYELSDYSSVDDAPIKMASVPQGMIDAIPVELDEGDRFNLRHDRMTKMAIYAINDACDSCDDDDHDAGRDGREHLAHASHAVTSSPTRLRTAAAGCALSGRRLSEAEP